jgi:hypothetical protein
MSLDTTHGASPNWTHVRPGMNLEQDVYGRDTTFRLGILQRDEVEIVKFLSIPLNEIQIYANGVPLLPVGTKFTDYIWKFPKYPVSGVCLKSISRHFMYGRPYSMAMKYLQALSDETVRNLIRKMRQAIEPPRAIKGRPSMYSRDIFEAGALTYGIDADAVKKLVEHDGITQGEMAMLQQINGMLDEFSSRSNTNLGVGESKKKTATATLQEQQEAQKMLGQSIISFAVLFRKMTDLRVCNEMKHIFEPTGSKLEDGDLKNMYRKYMLKNVSLGDGKIGDKIIAIRDKSLTESEIQDLADFEEQMSERGTPMKVKVVNANTAKGMPIRWHITITSKPKDGDDLDRMMFQDKIEQAMVISQATGTPLSGEKITSEFEETWKAKDWFAKGIGGMNTPMQEEPTGEGVSSALTKGIKAGTSALKPQKTNPTPTVAAKAE